MAVSEPIDDPAFPDTRSRILNAAAKLIAEGGIAALTTRSVAAAASVQAPTLYRLFGDKRGLLDAVAEHGLAAYVAGKSAATANSNPVQEMRDAWDAHVAFGLANPAVFAIMNEVGRDNRPSPAAIAGMAVLRDRVHRIARAGRLRVPEERAVSLIQAACNGTIATLLATPKKERDLELSPMARGAIVDAIVQDGKGPEDHGVGALAIGLRSHLDAVAALTPGERSLMRELLDRVSGASDELGRGARRASIVGDRPDPLRGDDAP